MFFGHSNAFYNICMSIDSNFNKCNPCDLCMQTLRLLVCNKLLKENYQKNGVNKNEEMGCCWW